MAVSMKLNGFFPRVRSVLGTVLTSAACLTSLGYDGALAQDYFTSQADMTHTAVSVDRAAPRQAMQMVINTSREITADQSFKRVRIQNPNVLTARPLEGGNRLEISAIATGITSVDLLAADDSVHTIEVMVLGDVRELEAVVRQLFPDGNVTVMPVQQGCIVSGFVTDAADVDQVIRIAEMYFPTVINNVQVTGVHTIQLEVQIMEVSRTKLRELGVDWALSNGDDTIRQGVSGLLSTATGTVTGSQNLTFGVIENSTSFFASINALRRNNLVKVLATPTLTAIDGRPASFNAGGEIPIVVPAGLGQVGIQFREFGTRLDYVAKVKGNGKIALEVRPYVSEIDPSRSVLIDGINVPGLRSRFLETAVELGAGQTLALGGLLQVRTEAINTGLPILSEMPFLGTFFRTTREEQNEIELLITVTPNFTGPMDPHEVPRNGPGMATQSPTDKELYLRGYIEAPSTMGADCEVPTGPGLIETMPYGQPIGSGSVYPVSSQPSVTPNPAAMSVGPNAPKLAQQPLYYTPQGGQADGGAGGGTTASSGGVIR